MLKFVSAGLKARDPSGPAARSQIPYCSTPTGTESTKHFCRLDFGSFPTRISALESLPHASTYTSSDDLPAETSITLKNSSVNNSISPSKTLVDLLNPVESGDASYSLRTNEASDLAPALPSSILCNLFGSHTVEETASVGAPLNGCLDGTTVFKTITITSFAIPDFFPLPVTKPVTNSHKKPTEVGQATWNYGSLAVSILIIYRNEMETSDRCSIPSKGLPSG